MMDVFLQILLYPMFWKMSIAERDTWHHIQTKTVYIPKLWGWGRSPTHIPDSWWMNLEENTPRTQRRDHSERNMF